MKRAAATLLLSMAVGCATLAIAGAQPASSPPAPSPAPSPVHVTFPDTMRISLVAPDTLPVSVPKRPPDPPWALIGALVGVVGALGGVVLGAMLGEGLRRRRERERIAQLKTALHEECRSLLRQVAQFIDLGEKMIARLREKRVLPGPAVRAIRTIYDATIAELAPHLTLLERNLLHVVHEKMKVGDELIASHLDDVRAEVRAGDVADPWATTTSLLEDQVENYRHVERLLKSFLDGKPEDVFYVQRPDGEPLVFERRRASAAIVPRTFEVARHFLRIVGAARLALHGIDLKIGADHVALGAGRALRPDLQNLHHAIEEFKASEARVIELHQPDLEAKLSRAFKDVEREYDQLDAHVRPYERPGASAESPSASNEFRILAESARYHVALLDRLIADLEKLTK